MQANEPLEIATFRTTLGWVALVASERAVKQLVFGHASAAAAQAALDPELVRRAAAGDDWTWLADRLKQFAEGQRADFRDVPIQPDTQAPFGRRVIQRCRAIDYGQVRSYGEVAALAGSPRAARAVGNVMAANRFSILVPCHRVINSDGSLGQYGGPGGKPLKRRLLELERRRLAAEPSGPGAAIARKAASYSA